MKQHFGFNIEVKTSSIQDAGRGVFVKDGIVPKFSITSMYPGQYYNTLLYFLKGIVECIKSYLSSYFFISA